MTNERPFILQLHSSSASFIPHHHHHQSSKHLYTQHPSVRRLFMSSCPACALVPCYLHGGWLGVGALCASACLSPPTRSPCSRCPVSKHN
ncbi:hypothetical protein FA15DRAFT_224803 [Coprinopsis marcescibilis]|uniref:Uncharacterized protein n=1 Tax=Coprinopsis marcescibilis TaxID=230819 RepID=A0A5C3KH15_COPMA|nr:hypothetical protein FA15DRAFT_224803 [Coprinopsis marcescibilis]